MNTTKLLTLMAAAAIFAGGLTGAPAQNTNDFSGGPRPGRGQLLRHLAQKLNLTDEQKTQIKAVLSADRVTLAGLLERLHEARRDLRTTIRAGDANETTVRAASARVAAVEADLAVERLKLYGKIAPILTDEQRRQLADFEQRVDDLVDNGLARLGEQSDD